MDVVQALQCKEKYGGVRDKFSTLFGFVTGVCWISEEGGKEGHLLWKLLVFLPLRRLGR